MTRFEITAISPDARAFNCGSYLGPALHSLFSGATAIYLSTTASAMSANGLTETTLRATGIGLMIVTALMVGVRAVMRAEDRRRVFWHDGWLVLGCLFFMAVSGVCVAKSGVIFRLLSVQEARLAQYPGLVDDALDVQKTFFFTSPGLWFTLWSIKFALLAFYRKTMVDVSLYTKLGWSYWRTVYWLV